MPLTSRIATRLELAVQVVGLERDLHELVVELVLVLEGLRVDLLARDVTSARAFEHGRPSGVNPALLHSDTRKPRSSIWIGTMPFGLLGLRALFRPPGLDSRGAGAWLKVR